MKRLLMLSLMFTMFITLVGCEGLGLTPTTENNKDIEAIYLLAQSAGTTDGMTYEEWLESIKGPDGIDGLSVSLQVANGFIQWKYENETTWKNLVSLTDLSGQDGRDVVFQASNGVIEWKYVDETSWTELLALSTITGPKGDTGLSAYELYQELNPEYTGSLEDWLNELTNSDSSEALTVQFNSMTSIDIDSQTVEYGAKATEPVQPTKDGYLFDGWYYEDTEHLWSFIGFSVTEDMTLTAKWIPNPIEITLNFINGDNMIEEVGTIIMGFDQVLDIPKSLTFGYEITNWYYDEDMLLVVNEDDVFTESTSLYANIATSFYVLRIYDLASNLLFEDEVLFNDNISFIYGFDLDNDVETNDSYYLDTELNNLLKTLKMPNGDLDLYFTPTAKYDGLPSDYEGVISLLTWSGSGVYYEDLGHLNLSADDLLSQNDAAYYAMAKAFNEEYPNVQINLLSLAGGPNDGGRIWEQELQNYKNQFGEHPSIWTTNDLASNVSKGLVADLSRFNDDPLYQQLNPSIMQMMNYYGFQAGLPQYVIPWGIYVNKELAIQKNIDVPDFDWTIDEYTDFIAHKEDNVYYGSMDTPLRILETGTNTITKQLSNLYQTGDFLDLNSEEVRSLIPYLNEWNTNSVWGNDTSPEFMDSGWWWSYKFFSDNKLLTLESDPWMMGDCATPSSVDNPWWGTCSSNDWDIYPRPSTDYVDNTIGIVLDPMAVYNYCLEDGDLTCTDEEELKIKAAYTFALFTVADTKAWQARAEMEFNDIANNVVGSALNDSLPVVTGEAFDEQMVYWYTPAKHQRFEDDLLMPGFQEVLRIYETGQFWDISDKSYPYFSVTEGTKRENLFEWKNYWNPDINGGFNKGDADFTNGILSQLYSWNTLANIRFAESLEDLQFALLVYYNIESNTENESISINGVYDQTININDPFNVFEGVTATDSLGTDISNLISTNSYQCEIDELGNVDTNLDFSNSLSCVIEYSVIHNGVLTKSSMILSFLQPMPEVNDNVVMEWTFDTEEDLNGFGIYVGGGGSLNMSIDQAALKMITTSGTQRYETRLDYQGIPLTGGYFYKVSFMAKSDIAGKIIHLNFGELLPSAPYFVPFKEENVDYITLTTDWALYSYVFYLEYDEPNGGPLFEMGDIEGSIGIDATIWIDNLLIEGGPIDTLE